MIQIHHKALEEFKEDNYRNLVYPHQSATRNRNLIRREFYTDESLEKYGDKTAEFSFECDYYEVAEGDLNKKYCLTQDMIKSLPIKIEESNKMFDKKSGEVVWYPTEWFSFRITPVKELELKEVIQPHITPHSNPDEYEQHVVTAFATVIGRTALWESANTAFGKSSIFESINLWHDNIPVIEQPKTVPAFYRYIPGDGVLVLDEMAKKDSESAMKVWYALNGIGNMSKTKLTMDSGGSAAYGTNVPKDLTNCSCVCLMNRCRDYSPKHREKFIEWMFHNNQSLDRRYLKLKPDDGQLDISHFQHWRPYNEDEKAWLRSAAKTIAWYKPHVNLSENKKVCGLNEEAPENWIKQGLEQLKDKFKQTHYDTVVVILKTYAVYCKDDAMKYYHMVERLGKWIKNYKMELDEENWGETPDLSNDTHELTAKPGQGVHDKDVTVVKMNEGQKNINDSVQAFEDDVI